MNKKALKELLAYRLMRASETLEEARLMQQEAHWNACANRLYYAAFYAVSALLVNDGHMVSNANLPLAGGVVSGCGDVSFHSQMP